MSRPPECDAACRAKILLNSERVIGEIHSAMNLSGHLSLPKDIAYQLIQILDEAEDKLVEWNNRRLEMTGYQRRTSKFLLEEVDSERKSHGT